MNRYQRQIQLPEIGLAGQAAFSRARVLVVGAGGLGVPVLQYLAGAGIGEITLIDPDLVSESNLHRQVIYGESIGQPKAEAAAGVLHGLNPSMRVTAHKACLDPLNAPDFVAAADLVLDCADSFAASYILSDQCLVLGKPLISASVLGLSGYVGGFCGGAPSLRAVFPQLPESLASCESAGVLGPVVGMFGTMMAQMALAQLAGIGASPLGQLTRFDMQNWRFSAFRFTGAPEPATHHPFIAAATTGPADCVIELRPETEAPRPVTPQAHRIPPNQLTATLLRKIAPDPGQRLVLACRSGLRAWRAADLLRPLIPNQIALIADPQTGDQS
ncbi:HesA/MoeB/ThiF family protein [Xinfangfangia sp. D13-10-4-6]|nr:HesA/MoeB/ThiF family protein [Pseudogemmobacter hezensis]